MVGILRAGEYCAAAWCREWLILLQYSGTPDGPVGGVQIARPVSDNLSALPM
jgi:hypothetical protein